MKKQLCLGCIAVLMTFSSAASALAEGKLKLEQLPPAVQKTVKAETQNATIVGISKEVEKGRTQYEIETKVNGKARDFNIDTSGALVVVEEEIAIDSVPAAARDAIMKKVADGKLTTVETVKQGSSLSYEASYVSKGGKKAEYGVNADGSVHK